MGKCTICAEKNVSSDHEISKQHIRNKILQEYAKHRKEFSGNRKGVIVSCSVQSSFSKLENYMEGKIKISAKPNEEITFNFTLENETKKEDIKIIFVQMLQNVSYFTMNDHGLNFGCNPVLLKPKNKFQGNVTMTFKVPDIGQYDMPIVFSFRKPATNEGILIMRDVVVFVESHKAVHDKVASPYTQEPFFATMQYKNTMSTASDDVFKIPKTYKPIYACGLKLHKDAPPEQKKRCEKIMEVFNTKVTKQNYIEFFHNLLWYEETIARINLRNFNMSGVPLLRQADQSFALVVPGLAEKRPSLITGDMLLVKPHNNTDVMFDGIIHDIQENVAIIRGLHPEFNKYYNFSAKFDVRFFMSRMPLERKHCAVHCVTINSPEMSRVFPTYNKQTVHVKSIKNYFNPLVESNPEQRCAVEHIVAGTAGLAPYLVHGPPGTGKTVTIVEAILQLVVKNSSNRIMVCTDSNMAADHVAMLIAKYASLLNDNDTTVLLRANSKFRIWETLPVDLRRYSNGYNRESFEPISIKEFKSHNIVVTTLSHAAKFAKQLKIEKMARHITHLFIDEAAQACEPSCPIPVCGLLSARGCLVLAGDPLQLGPVVISHHARRLGLGESLMERLKKDPLYSDERNDNNYMVMLKNNFRSDQDILKIPNELFYDDLLRPCADPDPLSAADILDMKARSRAIVFHGVLSKETRMGKSPSYFNDMEVEVVQQYIKALTTKHGVKPDDIGVVTPYIRQVYKIKKWLDTQHFAGRVEVGTVEAFQGKEKRVILVSCVRASCGLLTHDARFQLGFLVDDKRFNVALTRAKAKAIIIGNPLCLNNDSKWRRYMDTCRQFGTYHGYDPLKEVSEAGKEELVTKVTSLLKEINVKV